MTITPILCYHGIGDDYPEGELPFAFSLATFTAHLDAIAERGLRTVTMRELTQRRDAGDRAGLARTIAITFDDGYADLLSRVAPLLAQRGMVATAFLTTSYLDERSAGVAGAERWLSWDEARELARCDAFELGGHSHDHIELDMVDLAEAQRQIRACRQRLADELGVAPTSFAYPYGYSTAAVRDALAAAGFTSACGVKHALSSHDDTPFDLGRVRLLRRHSLAEATRWFDGTALRVAPCRDELRTRAFRPVRRVRHELRARRAVRG
jgi:peptidoglycan/xylan/chitin deacetylase (PgdA/CDA1 family)